LKLGKKRKTAKKRKYTGRIGGEKELAGCL
jgi:hypothetical protein